MARLPTLPDILTPCSSGLIYRPGRFSETDEVIALPAAAKPFAALYTTHMRNEGDRLLEAVDEALKIGLESGVHLHISHHKAAGAQPTGAKCRNRSQKLTWPWQRVSG